MNVVREKLSWGRIFLGMTILTLLLGYLGNSLKAEETSNFALGKRYQVSQAPYGPPQRSFNGDFNGPEKFPGVNKWYRGELTDGKIGGGSWTDPNWVMFAQGAPFTITLDLAKVYSITEVRVTTLGGGLYGIYFPKQLICSIGETTVSGEKTWKKVGEVKNEEVEDKSGLKIKTFIITFDRTKARRVKIEVKRPKHVFISEIEVLDQPIVSVDTTRKIAPFTDLDRGFDAAWISWFQVADIKAQLPALRADGFEIVRVHGTLSVTQMYTGRTPVDARGNPIYDYTYLDKWLDPLVKAGFKPMLIMDDVPNPISKHPEPGNLKNKAGVSDFNRWEDLIYRMFIHLQKRYGKEKVATWLAETWNEPDYGAYGAYHGDANFLKLQDYTVNAIKKADPRIRVGGPGTVTSTYRRRIKTAGMSEEWYTKYSKGKTVEEAPDWYDIVKHVATGKNYATGKRGTPLDFISSHMYDLKGQTQATDSARSIFKWMMDTVRSYPQLQGTKVIISEWQGSAAKWPLDVPYTAARALRTMVMARDIGLSGMIYEEQSPWPWSANKMFAGYPSLYTLQGVRTPQGAMLSLYNRLEGNQVATETTNEALGGISALKGKHLRVMLYYCEEDKSIKKAKNALLWINWPEAAGKKVTVKQYFVDEYRANARKLWEAMGSPRVADPSQLSQFKAAARIPSQEFTVEADTNGRIVLQTTMIMPAVQLFELSW